MTSRSLLVSVLLFTVAPASNGADATPVPPQKADTLDPEDIGIAKYVFEATPPAGKVMVLRCTRPAPDGKAADVFETVCFTNGAKAREVVLVFDPSKFPFNPNPRKPSDSRIRSQGGEMWFTGKRLSGWGTFGKKLELGFSNDAGEKEEVTFECFVEDYTKAKARIPKLPDANPEAKWTFNAFISPKM